MTIQDWDMDGKYTDTGFDRGCTNIYYRENHLTRLPLLQYSGYGHQRHGWQFYVLHTVKTFSFMKIDIAADHQDKGFELGLGTCAVCQ